MSRVVTIRLTPEIHDALTQHAAQRKLAPMVDARDILRRGVGVVRTEYEAGYAEGLQAAHAEILRKLHGGTR